MDHVPRRAHAARRVRLKGPARLALVPPSAKYGDVLGGALGQVWGGWLQVTHLWVAETVRGQGHGRRLMKAAESYARSRGAIGATLETHSFQARPFYERLGYEVFGTLDGYPPGHAKCFLRKALV